MTSEHRIREHAAIQRATGEPAAPDGSGPVPAATSGDRPAWWRRGAEVGVVVLAVVAIATVGVGLLRPDRGDFCARMGELPSLETDAATPATSLTAYADSMDRAADVAPDDATAAAARTLATHERALAEAIGTGSSSDDLLDRVATVDTEDLGAARSTMDAALDTHCR